MTKKRKPHGGTHAERIRRERAGGASAPPVPSSPQEDDDFGWDYATPDEMREWAQREMRDAAKALDLRAQELIHLVTAYSSGKITPEKADELMSRYQHRWGEALPGATLRDPGDGPPLTDQQILATIDERNTPFISPREAWEHNRARRVKPDDGKSR